MIFKLTPSCKDYIWGGTRLKAEFGKVSDTDIIAETWELSCHADGKSYLPSGESLEAFFKANPKAMGTACNKFNQFPLLIKLIDADKDLSVQVHPSDEYALKNENQLGKTEMWYVVDCAPRASLYCGFNRDVTLNEYKAAIQNNTLCSLLNKVSVKKGDMFFIKAGTIHAIGAGIVIAEIQQSSNVTYRVYDYNRKGADGKARELHVEKACQVTSLNAAGAEYNFGSHLAQCEYFTVDKLCVNGSAQITADEKSFKAVLVLEGCITIGDVTANKGDSVFISADSGKIDILGNGEALITYVE